MHGAYDVLGGRGAHAFSVGIVKGFQLHDVGVSDDAHDLKLAVLKSRSGHGVLRQLQQGRASYLESLVLKNTLDGGILARRRKLGLEHDTERAVPYNLTLGVRQVSGLASDAILYFLADDFCMHAQFLPRPERRIGGQNLPPILRELKAAFGRLDDMTKGGGCLGAFNQSSVGGYAARVLSAGLRRPVKDVGCARSCCRVGRRMTVRTCWRARDAASEYRNWRGGGGRGGGSLFWH